MAPEFTRFWQALAQPRLRRFGLGLCSVSLLGLTGCSSNVQQFVSRGKQVLEAMQQANVCSPQLHSLRLLVKAGPNGEMPQQAVMDEAIAELIRRLESSGIREPQVSQWGEDSIEVFFNGEFNSTPLVKLLTLDVQLDIRPQRMGTEEKAYPVVQDFYALQSELRQAEAANAANANLGNSQELAELRGQFKQAQASVLELFEESQLTTTDIAKALPVWDSSARQEWSTHLEFTPEAADKFAELTRNLAGTGRSLGIFVDGELVSAPVIDVAFVEDGITGGKAVINGDFTEQEVKALAAQLNTRLLSTQLELQEQYLVDNPDCPSSGL